MFSSININKHKVATLGNKNELYYVYPVDKYEFDCVDEELYSMKSQRVHMIRTKEHKLYLKRRGNTNFEFIVERWKEGSKGELRCPFV